MSSPYTGRREYSKPYENLAEEALEALHASAADLQNIYAFCSGANRSVIMG